jgi:hypothetical protein
MRPDKCLSVIGKVRQVAIAAFGVFFTKTFGVLDPRLQFVSQLLKIRSCPWPTA